MSATRFAGPKLSEHELFIATLLEPRAIGGMPKELGERGVGVRYWNGSKTFDASIEYFGEPANSSKGTPGELKAVKLGWNTNSDTRPQALPHKLRKLTTKPEQKGWVRTTSEDSVTVRLGGLSITGLFGTEMEPSIRVEGSVDAIAAYKRVIEKLIEHTIVDDKKVPSPGVTRRYDRSDKAAEPVNLGYGALLIGYVEDISNYQPGQDITKLIVGSNTLSAQPEQVLQNVA